MSEIEKQKQSRKRTSDTKNTGLIQGKVQPQAPDLEEAVLGAIMLEKNALNEVLQILKPEHFYIDAHRYIWEAIVKLFNDSKPVDILTVTQELRQAGNLEFAGGAYYITQLTNRVASAANVEFYARIITEKYIQRELIRIGSEMATEAFEETADVLKMLDKAQGQVFAIAEENIKKNAEGLDAIIKKAIKNIESAKEHESSLTGVPSGLLGLDTLTSGWQKSDLVILAARPGMGKTALTLSVARNAAVDHNKGVAVFSLEMSSVQLALRLISAEAEINQENLRSGKLSQQDWEQLTSRVTKLNDAKLFIDDTPAISIFELRAKCRRLKAQHDINLVIIDYLQLMRGDEKSSGNREQEISLISRSLKAMAKELDVPVIALSQLSRAVETRGTSKRPILSDLRESGSIEQDADMVLFIYRPEYYKLMEWEDGTSTMGKAEIIVAKNRHGQTKEIRTRFIGQYGKFTDDDDSAMFGGDFGLTEDFRLPETITLSSRMNDMDDEHAEEVPPF
ncbi:MAG: replicative DNA helicase [Bacteroidetes bacterium]|nr:MAG: replicative DNA helicase [Bacteroidota bacterium]